MSACRRICSTRRSTRAPWIGRNVKLIAIDPDPTLVDRARREKGGGLAIGCTADPKLAVQALIPRARKNTSSWLKEARAALDSRPAEWSSVVAQTPKRLHPAEVF